MNTELQEIQRYGRNKTTAINYSYINSGEFRKKFDRISDDKELNRKVYQIAKKILKLRSGTNFEDMYWMLARRAQALNKEQKLELVKLLLKDC